MILHTLNDSPASAAYRDCLALLQPGDALVLMGDAVYAALEGTQSHSELAGLKDIGVFALAEDMRMAGVPVIAPGVQAIGMEELVRLTEQYPRQQAWY